MEMALTECRKVSALGALAERDLLDATSELVAAHLDTLVTLVRLPNPAFSSSGSVNRRDPLRARLAELQGEVFQEYEMGMYTLPGDPSSPVVINVTNIRDSSVGNVQQAGGGSDQQGGAK